MPAEDVRRSLMIGCVYDHAESDLAQKVEVRTRGKRTSQQLFEKDFPVGIANQIVDQLGRWVETNISRIMLQWLDLDDIDSLEGLAHGVLYQLDS